MKKCLQVNMDEARKGGVENLERVTDIIHGLKGSKNSNGQTVLCAYSKPYFSGVVLADGDYGEVSTTGIVFIPLENINFKGHESLLSSEVTKKVLTMIVENRGLDVVEIEGK